MTRTRRPAPGTEGPFETVAGVYHDGQSAADVAVMVRVEMDDLVVIDREGVVLARWPLADLKLAGGSMVGGELRLRRSRSDLDRVTLSDPDFIRQLVAHLPHLREERIFDLRRVRFLGSLMLAMAAAIGVLFFLLVPLSSRWLVDVVPRSWEARIGERVEAALIDQYAEARGRRPEDLICEGSLGRRALDTLIGRMESVAGAGFPLQVTVVDLDVVNAFAMPGGRLLVFRGLLDFAQSGDEVAAVIAHEIAHVRQRHPSQKIFEGGATSVLLNLMFGDFGGRSLALSIGQLLLNARYSREMEHEADRLAVDIMRDARIDPAALSRFLGRINQADTDSNPATFGWLMSHPALPDRAEAIGALITGEDSRRPVLSAAQFLRLRLICADRERQPAERLPTKER